MSDDLIGATIGHCVIRDLLGQGGMARVYRGWQENLDRAVAIKILPPYYASDPAFVERFKLEARATAKLSHPNIVTVHDAGEDAGHLYILMEYVSGGTLKAHIANGMPMTEVQRIIREVASALSYAHSMGIVHRDVKPVNVLLDQNARAVLSDFGIAKVLQTSAALTHAGAGVGTPEYMSPEQCRGGAVDQRADIYALGVMLYEMLTGRTPFAADNYTALAHSHIYEPVPPPSQLNPRISPAVQSVILKALEKDPADRFPKATDLAYALDQAVAAQVPVPLVAGRASAGVPPLPTARPQTMPGPRPGAQPPVSTIFCPRCHQPTGAASRFCTSCGLPLVPAQQVPPPQRPPVQPTGSWSRCAACGSLNQPRNSFCTQCGTSLLAGVAALQCHRCGARSAAGSHFCTNCGAPFR